MESGFQNGMNGMNGNRAWGIPGMVKGMIWEK